jgi:hypothetical protein
MTKGQVHEYANRISMTLAELLHLEPNLLKENDEKRKKISNHDMDALIKF